MIIAFVLHLDPIIKHFNLKLYTVIIPPDTTDFILRKKLEKIGKNQSNINPTSSLQ